MAALTGIVEGAVERGREVVLVAHAHADQNDGRVEARTARVHARPILGPEVGGAHRQHVAAAHLMVQ